MNRFSTLAGTLALGVLIAALFHDTLLWLARQWLSNDYYAHGMLIPAVSAVLIWRRWGTARPTPVATLSGGLLTTGGIAVHVWATAVRAYYVSALCIIIVLAGLVLFFRGAEALRRSAFPLLFLIAAVPLPFVERLSLPLQLATAHVAGTVASTLGLQVTQSGAQLALAGCSFVVGAPCSGLRSLVTFAGLVALLIYVTEGPRWAKAALVVLVVPVALAANVLRVTALLAVAQVAGEDLAIRYYHTLFGLAFYVLAIAALIILTRLLRCHEIRPDI